MEVISLCSAIATTTIDTLRLFFAREDNQWQWPTDYLTGIQPLLSKQWIKHTLIPPYHPATNKVAERVVQVIKQAVKKMSRDLSLKQELAWFLLIYCTTPHATTQMRPDKLFLHQQLWPHLTSLQPIASLLTTVEKHQLSRKQHIMLDLYQRRNSIIAQPKGCTQMNGKKDTVTKEASKLFSKSGFKGTILSCISFT